MTQLTAQQILAIVQTLIKEAPPLKYGETLGEVEQRWLGRVSAILNSSGQVMLAVSFQTARSRINSYGHDRSAVLQPLYDIFYDLELKLPSSLQGAFIPPGDTWNGFAALVKVMQADCDNLLVVDPYTSADIFTELMPHVVARHGAKLLTVKQP